MGYAAVWIEGVFVAAVVGAAAATGLCLHWWQEERICGAACLAAVAAWLARADVDLPLRLKRMGAQALAPLPPGAKAVECCDNPALRALGPLPASVLCLLCERCPHLRQLGALPAGMTFLGMNSVGLTSLPALPPALHTLMCWNLGVLRALPALPSALLYVHLSNLTLQANLPALPASLRVLKLDACVLQCLGPLPAALGRVRVNSSSCAKPSPVCRFRRVPARFKA